MKIMSHYLCLNATDIRPRMIVDVDETGCILDILSFDELRHEPAGTVFTDGIISGELLRPVDLSAADALAAIAACARPIRVGERNRLLVWKGVDLAARRFTSQSRSQELRSCVV